MHALSACSMHVDVCAYARVRGRVHMRMYSDGASCLCVSIHLRSQVCECTRTYVCSQCARSDRACIVLPCRLVVVLVVTERASCCHADLLLHAQGACRARP